MNFQSQIKNSGVIFCSKIDFSTLSKKYGNLCFKTKNKRVKMNKKKKLWPKLTQFWRIFKLYKKKLMKPSMTPKTTEKKIFLRSKRNSNFKTRKLKHKMKLLDNSNNKFWLLTKKLIKSGWNSMKCSYIFRKY